MHQIRVALHGKGFVLMGKNTMVRRALQTVLSEHPCFKKTPLSHIKVILASSSPLVTSMTFTTLLSPTRLLLLPVPEPSRPRTSESLLVTQVWNPERLLPSSRYPHQDHLWYRQNCF
ncbi:hypothetical protein GYMLUDRAFT_981923 [Collybiopsis luxurians FD-317 M1]|nr:hypothetical protein GYMLUDRAFT_981923 [Collybiopsis luxurians FD-317 M1]